jgi:hypothetical protein
LENVLPTSAHALATMGRCMPPITHRTDKRRHLTGRFFLALTTQSQLQKNQVKGGSHGDGHDQMPANGARDPDGH